MAGSIDRDPPLYLHYAPEVPALAQYEPFLGTKQFPMLVPPDASAFFHSGELVAGSSLGLNGLDEIYRVLLPLLMLLIGANVLPQTRVLYGTLFTLPVRRSTLFLLHAAALATICALLLGLAFALSAAAAVLTKGYDPEILSLLFNIHVLLLLYGGVFAFLGLALAAISRQRGVALLLGVTVVVVIITILPNLRNTMYFTYISEHETEFQLATLQGRLPDDPLYQVTRAMTLSPGTAYTRSMSMMAYDVKFPESAFCPDCNPWETRWGYLNRARIALAAMSFGLMALGAVAFSRREAAG